MFGGSINNIFNDDFREFLNACNKNNVKYVLVGGYSVIIYGYHRVTGDMDILVEPSEKNYNNLMKAFAHFGLPLNAISLEDFLMNSELDVFTFGRPPTAIDIMTKLADFQFDDIHSQAVAVSCDGLVINVIHLNQLKKAKRIAGRFKDLDDLEKLNSL